MYVPRTKPELFDLISSLFMYLPDLTQYEYVESMEQVERDFNQALDAVFVDGPAVHRCMKDISDAAFAECRKGDGMRAGGLFALIIDELTPSIGFPKQDEDRTKLH